MLLLWAAAVRAYPFCGDFVWCSTCCPCRLICIWTVSEPMRCFSVAALGRDFWARAGTNSWTSDGRCCWRCCLCGLAGVAWFGTSLPEKILLLPLGMLAMPALHGLLRRSGATSPRVFLVLGRYSFMIYLFNTIFIGLAKGILLHFWSWDGPHFLPFAMVLMTAGILGPVMLKQAVFRHVSALDRLTDLTLCGREPGHGTVFGPAAASAGRSVRCRATGGGGTAFWDAQPRRPCDRLAAARAVAVFTVLCRCGGGAGPDGGLRASVLGTTEIR